MTPKSLNDRIPSEMILWKWSNVEAMVKQICRSSLVGEPETEATAESYTTPAREKQGAKCCARSNPRQNHHQTRQVQFFAS